MRFWGEKYETDTLYFLNDIHLIRPASQPQPKGAKFGSPGWITAVAPKISIFHQKPRTCRLPPRLMGLNMNWFEICFKLMLAGHKSRDMWRSSDHFLMALILWRWNPWRRSKDGPRAVWRARKLDRLFAEETLWFVGLRWNFKFLRVVVRSLSFLDCCGSLLVENQMIFVINLSSTRFICHFESITLQKCL